MLEGDHMKNACEETTRVNFSPCVTTLHPRESFSGHDAEDLILFVPIIAAIVEIGAAIWLLSVMLHFTPVADTTTAAPNILPFENVERTLAANH